MQAAPGPGILSAGATPLAPAFFAWEATEAMRRPQPEPVSDRVRAAIEAALERTQALSQALAETPQPERADALAPVVLDLLQQMTGLQALLIPLAAQMDILLHWQQEVMAWQAETNGKLLFSTPPVNRRA